MNVTADSAASPNVLRVCFVCTGNICRSPMAEVVLRQQAIKAELPDGSLLSDHLVVTSAGTGAWHAGEPMDPRALRVLESAGYVDHGHRAQKFEASWFGQLDLVVGMARQHCQVLQGLARRQGAGADRLVLLRSYDSDAGGSVDIPDPYYGDASDFEECLAMAERGCRGLTMVLIKQLVDGGATSR